MPSGSRSPTSRPWPRTWRFAGHIAVVGALGELLSPRVESWEVTFAGPAFGALDVDGAGGLGGLDAELLSARGEESLVRVKEEAGLTRLLDAVRASGGTLISVAARRETLEDIYMKEVAR